MNAGPSGNSHYKDLVEGNLEMALAFAEALNAAGSCVAIDFRAAPCRVASG